MRPESIPQPFMHNGCGTCNYALRIHGKPFCAWCGQALLGALFTLASNLRVAAGLERAFHVGSMFGMRASIEGRHTKAWTSNTDGKAAP